MEIENYHHKAAEIASEAEIETLESYEENINKYESKDYTYIPIPQSNQYYSVQDGWLGSLRPEQIIRQEANFIEVMKKLQNLPFLLIDRYISTYFVYDTESDEVGSYGGYPEVDHERNKAEARDTFEDSFDGELDVFTADTFVEKHPDKASETMHFPRYQIITLADLNRRPVKEMLYRLFAELASSLSDRIANQHQDSEELFDQVRPVVIGRWKKAKMEGVNLHISENMNITDMKNVLLASNRHFVKACGFDDKEDVETLDSLSDIRNSVMHANRSLVHDRSDIDDVLDAINEAERILSNMP